MKITSHSILSIAFLFSFSFVSRAQNLPVLKRYDQAHLYEIALPLGGIGTGAVALGGRGELRDWEIMNKPAKGFAGVTVGNDAPFFSIYIKPQNQRSQTRALLGPLYPHEYRHYEGRPVNHHGLPRFESASFEAAYPFGQVNLKDKRLPVAVKIQGFNPLVPGDLEASSIPIAVLRYQVTNNTDKPMDVSVCGSMRNFVGIDGSKQSRDWKGDILYKGAKNNQNTYKESPELKGIFMYSDSVDKDDPAWGSMALSTPSDGTITYRRSSAKNAWSRALLHFWDDFSADGLLTDLDSLYDHDPMASLAVKKTVAPRQTQSFTFYITWRFPNRQDWNEAWTFGAKHENVGNFYAKRYKNAWDVAQKTALLLPDLEQKTKKFVNAFIDSDYPEALKEAALFNLSTLRSQTVFRLPSGHYMGWEGVMDEVGSCFGNCTHVWNYETATAYLFPKMARSMREVEFEYGLKENGKMPDRVYVPLIKNKDNPRHGAADGQLGSIMQFYREWQLSGDDDWLKKHWPKVKKAMQYAWVPGGWDANQDGLMEGKQHNTMDVNYYGPNPQMQFWYLGALRACEETALYLKDKKFARKCRKIYEKGSKATDKELFNGNYYEQKITDPKSFEYLDLSDPKTQVPDYQLGSGCLVDQLVGQYMAHLCGLGYLAKEENVKTALRTVLKENQVESFDTVFNNMRSYVLGDEAGLIMASWPKGRLEVPFPYFAESMTGFEYVVAAGAIYEGMTPKGLEVIKNIRNRFDGQKRNPFSEPECGRHYARAMASWSATLAYTGFLYSAPRQSLSFDFVKDGRYFWSIGSAWGIVMKNDDKLTIDVLSGNLTLKGISVNGYVPLSFKKAMTINGNKEFELNRR